MVVPTIQQDEHPYSDEDVPNVLPLLVLSPYSLRHRGVIRRHGRHVMPPRSPQPQRRATIVIEEPSAPMLPPLSVE